jgi:hypothetical protein
MGHRFGHLLPHGNTYDAQMDRAGRAFLPGAIAAATHAGRDKNLVAPETFKPKP